MIPTELHELVQRDGLHRLEGLDRPAFIHNDHRWALPLMAWAQSSGVLGCPALMIMMDHHTDFAPTALTTSVGGPELITAYNSSRDLHLVYEACEHHLVETDGDWVRGGMELGIIGDAVLMGADHGQDADETGPLEYRDVLSRTTAFGHFHCQKL